MAHELKQLIDAYKQALTDYDTASQAMLREASNPKGSARDFRRASESVGYLVQELRRLRAAIGKYNEA